MQIRNLALILFLLFAVSLTACRSVAASEDPAVTVSALAFEETDAADVPTATPEPATATASATATPTSRPTETETPMATATATPSATATATATATEAPPTATYPPPPEAVNVPILMYHYISELPPDADIYRRDLTVTPERFAAQLRYLADAGYETVTLADVHARLTTGAPLPERPIVLTFDDGYKDALTNALPLLQQYGFVGEFFVLATPAHHEAPNYLSWVDMRTMAEAGMSIQAHGRDHYDLTNRDYDFLVYQVLGSREAVEAHTDQPVRFFCYPSGRHDAAVEAVVGSAGYLGAVTTAWGTELRLDNAYAWPRIRVKGAWDQAQFANVLASLPASN
jgi:peptidoglycan/xylan/chitin deacetylase (PgdA/CDA1 family)